MVNNSRRFPGRMITSETSETFKVETNPPISMIKERTIAMMKENDEFQSKNKPSLLLDHFKKENDDLIETDDELLEVGSNENPDGSDEDEDDEDDDREDSTISRPLDFTTGRKLSESGKQFKSWKLISLRLKK